MKRTFFLLWALLLYSAVSMNAQVRIGGDTLPHAAAVLDLNANNDPVPAGNKGALALPRVSLTGTTAKLNNAVPANGMMVYNTGGTLSAGIYYWNGTQWMRETENSAAADLVGPLITWVPVKFRTSVSFVTSLAPIPQMSIYNADSCVVAYGHADVILWPQLTKCIIITPDVAAAGALGPNGCASCTKGSYYCDVNMSENYVHAWVAATDAGHQGSNGPILMGVNLTGSAFVPLIYWRSNN